MIRQFAFLALASASFSVAACDKLNAVFENEHASNVLSVLATEAGFTLVNPELATGRLNATFEGENANKLLPVIAWDLGFELQVQGRNVRLQRPAAEATKTQPDSGAKS